jgi:hypothetical protein
MKFTNLFKLLLLTQALLVFAYTIVAFKNEGANLFGIFLLNIQNFGWNGQFNLDFSCYLTLSGLWIMWRNKFTTFSIIFGVVAMILGIIVFAPYVLYLFTKENGDFKKLLIGE